MRLIIASSILLALVVHVESMPRIARVIPPRPMDYNLMGHHNYLARKSAHQAHAVMNHQTFHQRNVVQSPPAQSAAAAPTALEANASPAKAPTSSPSTWRNQTAAACMQSLTALNGKASNPSGLAACYNIQSFESSTGIFNADLQLYRVAAATGDWVALMTHAVNVGLSYADPAVAPGNPNHKREQELALGTPAEARKVERPRARRAAAAAPTMVQEMAFLGKINGNRVKDGNDT